jgi:hypothetical protein
MNRYPTPRFRLTFAIAAVAMSVLTFALAVGLPTSLAPAPAETSLAAYRSAPTPAAGVFIVPEQIVVIGIRDTNIAGRPVKPRG